MATEQKSADANVGEPTAVASAPVTTASEAPASQVQKNVAEKNEDKSKAGGRGGTKGKKRKTKMPRDVTAPRQPLTGYVRYLNERRDSLRADDPSLSFAEVTKRLASEWGRLPAQEKQQYLDAAEQDRERYIKEWSVYKESDAYKAFKQQQQERKEAEEGGGKAVVGGGKRQKGGVVGGPHSKVQRVDPNTDVSQSTMEGAVPSTGVSLAGSNTTVQTISTAPSRPKAAVTPSSANSGGQMPGVQDSSVHRGVVHHNTGGDTGRETDIPIFTEQFLHHNKLREAELRQLRKANTDYEQQNAILQKHIESVRGAVERTKSDIVSQRARTTMLRGHLMALQERLVRGLANVTLPNSLRGPTKQNIEQYMDSLRNLAVENKSHAAVKQAREFLSKMEMPA